MRYLSVCSGIEAASVAFKPYGWEPIAFSEIDKAASNLLHRRHPGVPNWGDMSKFQEWPDATVDVLCGGTPCQSFSVAGLRQGLADPRGNLMLTFGAIAGRYRPKWLVWENVPGVLSSNGGRDFGAFLGMLGELGYGVAYRVLDAQHVRTCRFPHAVPQRRRRVFVVGYTGDWRRAAAVLFDRESLSGHPAPRREAGQKPAGSLAARTTGGGGLGTDFDLDGGLVAADVAPTLDASFHDKQGLDNQHINGGGGYSLPPVSHCLNAGGMGRIDYESETFIPTTGGGFDVAHSLRGEGFDASEDGTGRGTPLWPVAIQERAVSENPNNGPDGAGIRQDGAAYTLEARSQQQAVAFDLNQITSATNRSQPDPAVHHTLPATATQPHLAIPFDCKGSEVQFSTDGANPTMRAMGHANSHQNGGGHLAVAFDLRGREGGAMPEGPHDTANIRAAAGGSSRSYVAQHLDGDKNGTAEKGRSAEVLHGLRCIVGEEAFRQWQAGGPQRVPAPEVLRSSLHGAKFRCASGQTRSIVDDGTPPRPESLSAGELRALWEAGADRCSSSGRELAEQRSGKPDPAVQGVPHAPAPWAVRRLTPVECERLQGFPDGYTDVPVGNRRSADGPRYKMLGNSWAVNVVDYIAERIAEVDAW